MKSEKVSWGKAEWQTHAEQMEARYLETLDGWGETVRVMQSCSEETRQQRDHIETLLADLRHAGLLLEICATVPRQPTTFPAIRKTRGRPRKADKVETMAMYSRIESEYLEAHKVERAPSVKAVLRWCFTEEFKRQGLAMWRLNDKTFRTKLLSFEKRISEARTHMRVNKPK